MKTQTFLFALSGLLLLSTYVTYANTNVGPQLIPLQKQKSAIFQVPKGEEKNVLVKIRNDRENTIMEIEIDPNAHKKKLFNFSKLMPGTYYMDIFHNNIITRKELLVQWDGVRLINLFNMQSEPTFRPPIWPLY